MASRPLSPKRRHILSSINPEGRSTSPPIEGDHMRENAETPPPPPEQPRDADQTEDGVPEKKRTSKFRFKSKHSRSHRSSRHRDGDHGGDDEDEDRSGTDYKSSSSRRHHRSHRHHHRHHRHKRRRSRSRSPTPPNPYEPPPLDSEAAFRESLFDAMADDEGAAYWEGVYGQPIHVYPQSRPTGPEGELERMNDEEYATYVRQKMWEKTHQGLLEERARREERRKEKAAQRQAAERLTDEMERSLRKGEERRKRRGWRERWEEYSRAWDPWDGTLEGLAWPVRSGRREDVESDAVREFYILGIDAVEVGETEFITRLKDERVKWHPDKIQQRLGGGVSVDEAVMRDVTAVFQIVDRLWSDTRSRAKQAK